MKNKVNILFALFVAFFLTSCSTIGSYNQPFINTDETLKISEGMTKELVLINVGQPYYVKSGENGSNEEVWVYQVRTLLVQSNTTTQQANKTNIHQKHAGVHHELQITFKNSKVISWGPHESSEQNSDQKPQSTDKEEKTADKNSDMSEPKKNKPSFFSKIKLKNKPSLSFSKLKLEAHQGIAYNDKFNGGDIAISGLTIGYGAWGLEITVGEESSYASGVDSVLIDNSDDYYYDYNWWNEGGDYIDSFFLTYTKKRNNLLMQGGIGITNLESWNSEYVSGWYGYENYDDFYKNGLALRLGVAYEQRLGKFFAIIPTYVANIGFEENGYSSLFLKIKIGT